MNLTRIILEDVGQLRPLELLRANSVERFAMSPMTRTQTIAAHQWDVAMLFVLMSQYIVTQHKESVPVGRNQEWLLAGILMALNHDMGEIFTGDGPAPFKHAYNLEVNPHLPNWVQRLLQAWRGMPGDLSHRERLIQKVVKVSDVLSTWHWANQFGNHGDAYAEKMTRHLAFELNDHLTDTAAFGRRYGYSFHRYWFDIADRFEHHVTEYNAARSIWDLEEEDEEE